MKSRRYKFKKSHTVARQPQGSVSKAALGKAVSANRAAHFDTGQRNTRRFSGQVERREQTAAGRAPRGLIEKRWLHCRLATRWGASIAACCKNQQQGADTANAIFVA